MALTQKQLDLRRRGITGTDIARLVNGHAMDVWLSKKGILEMEETEAMEWGNRLEDLIAEKYTEQHAVALHKPQTLVHPSRPWQVGTPDRLVMVADPTPYGAGGEPPFERGVEIKTRGAYAQKQWDEDGVPAEVVAQVQWYDSLVEVQVWHVAVLFGGRAYREYEVQGNHSLQADLITVGEDFWKRHVLANVAPAPDGSDSWAKYLRERFPGTTGEIVPATDELEGMALEWRARASLLRKQEQAIEESRQRIALHVGDGAGMRLSDGTVIPRRYRKEFTQKPREAKVVPASSWIELPRAWRGDDQEGEE